MRQYYNSTSQRPYCIYTLSIGDTIIYVGKCSQRLNDRLNGHKLRNKALLSMYSDCLDCICIEAIEYCSKDEMKFNEVYWINQLTAWGFALINQHYNNKRKEIIPKKHKFTVYH